MTHLKKQYCDHVGEPHDAPVTLLDVNTGQEVPQQGPCEQVFRALTGCLLAWAGAEERHLEAASALRACLKLDKTTIDEWLSANLVNGSLPLARWMTLIQELYLAWSAEEIIQLFRDINGPTDEMGKEVFEQFAYEKLRLVVKKSYLFAEANLNSGMLAEIMEGETVRVLDESIIRRHGEMQLVLFNGQRGYVAWR